MAPAHKSNGRMDVCFFVIIVRFNVSFGFKLSVIGTRIKRIGRIYTDFLTLTLFEICVPITP